MTIWLRTTTGQSACSGFTARPGPTRPIHRAPVRSPSRRCRPIRTWRSWRSAFASRDCIRRRCRSGLDLSPGRTMHPLRNVRRLPLPGAGERGCRCLCGATGARVTRRRDLDRRVRRPDHDRSVGARATGVEVERGGERVQVEADFVVVACGAVNSAALLLRSATDRHPHGLANSSGLVGRNYMVHTNSVLVAIDPRRPNPTVFQKTISVNDFYRAGIDPEFPFPMGNLQPVGKLQGVMMRGAAPYAPDWSLRAAAQRSVDWWVMSEDLPDPANRVTLDASGNIVIHWRPNNLAAHDRLMGHAKTMLRRAGYPVLLDRRMGIATNSHQCGTLRFGHDPGRSVLDPYCRAHDLDNLYVVDASFFPSSAAVNPALTIAAQALARRRSSAGATRGCRVAAASTRSCSGMTDKAERLAGYRHRRDHFFAEHPHSPLE